MKPIFFKLILLLTLFSNLSTAVAQRDGESRKEKMKALKVAFVTEELELTGTEAQQFWPVYNEYEAAMATIKKDNRKSRMTGTENLSESEMNAWLDNHLKREEDRVSVKRTYIAKFKKVLPVQKVVKLISLEQKFKKELLQKVRENRREEGGGERRRKRF
jgi:hypothetical protein